MIILYPTNAGFALENAALIAGVPVPKISRMIVGTGVPHADPASAEALVGFRAAATQTAVISRSPEEISIRAGIDPSGTYTITEVGIELEDGTLYAYGEFSQPFLKGSGVGFEFQCVLSRQNLDNIRLDLNILDVNALADGVKELALADFLVEAAPLIAEALAGKAPIDGEGTSGTWSISIEGSAGNVAWANVSGKPNIASAGTGSYWEPVWGGYSTDPVNAYLNWGMGIYMVFGSTYPDGAIWFVCGLNGGSDWYGVCNTGDVIGLNGDAYTLIAKLARSQV